jgi:hypothetical protein
VRLTHYCGAHGPGTKTPSSQSAAGCSVGHGFGLMLAVVGFGLLVGTHAKTVQLKRKDMRRRKGERRYLAPNLRKRTGPPTALPIGI